MTTPETMAQAKDLLARGFVISALNVLVDDAREVGRAALRGLVRDAPAWDVDRAALVEALGLAVARLQAISKAIQNSAPPTEAQKPKPRGRPKK